MKVLMAAVDGSDASHRAVAVAADLAVRFGTPLHLVHVVKSAGTGHVPRGLAEYDHLEHLHLTEAELIRSAAEQTVATAASEARARGVADVQTEVASGDPTSVLVERARELGADMLVMGRRGLGDLSGMLLGSVSHKVTHHAECAVLTVP